MHIDSYQFGRIVIDGVNHTKDIIIIGAKTLPNWWRKQSHLLFFRDIEIVLTVRPSVLVVKVSNGG
jgi:hypothetical protein